MENIWGEIRNDFCDDSYTHIDAWLTADDNEEGTVIAKIDMETGEVQYLDDRAKTDKYAQELINEIQKQRLLDRVLKGIERDFETGDITAVEELLTFIPKENLVGYLPEEEWKNY